MLKNNRGFTLVEMLVVMLIITVLLLLIIPNISNQTSSVNDKGCDALVAVVQAQTDAFYFDKGNYPEDIEELEEQGFIEEKQMKCHNNIELTIDSDGKVSKSDDAS